MPIFISLHDCSTRGKGRIWEVLLSSCLVSRWHRYSRSLLNLIEWTGSSYISAVGVVRVNCSTSQRGNINLKQCELPGGREKEFKNMNLKIHKRYAVLFCLYQPHTKPTLHWHEMPQLLSYFPRLVSLQLWTGGSREWVLSVDRRC
jgi:hypothetical protein